MLLECIIIPNGMNASLQPPSIVIVVEVACGIVDPRGRLHIKDSSWLQSRSFHRPVQ